MTFTKLEEDSIMELLTQLVETDELILVNMKNFKARIERLEDALTVQDTDGVFTKLSERELKN